MREIQIVIDGSNQYHLMLNNDSIEFNDLKSISLDAVGLKYTKDNKSHLLKPTNENVINLPPEVYSYEIVTSYNNFQELSTNARIIEKIKEYFQLRYYYTEIVEMLRVKDNIIVSHRTLLRILKEQNLKRKNIIESSREEIITALLIENNDFGKNLGYRSLWQRLRDKYKLSIKQSTVLELLRKYDPQGVEKRLRYRLQRRRYRVAGPNYLFHFDGNDKLKTFGFYIHGCVDGFSKKVMWLRVATTNKLPAVIGYYYLECLNEFDLIPTLIRSDKGTENVLIDILHAGLRTHHKDENAGFHSFLKGKSTANERIEKYWYHLRLYTLDFFINLFKAMQHKRILDTSDIVHIEFLRFCFGPLIQYSLDRSKKEWNEHRFRKQKNYDLPSSIPNVMYYWPSKYGGKDCKKEVKKSHIEKLKSEFTKKPKLYCVVTEKIVKILLPDVKVPITSEEAFNLFIKLTKALKTLA